jgi:hypothetical protein
VRTVVRTSPDYETLIEAGANMLATSKFGDPVGWAVEHSRVVCGAEAKARPRVFAKLRNLGFPFSAARNSIVLARSGRASGCRSGRDLKALAPRSRYFGLFTVGQLLAD